MPDYQQTLEYLFSRLPMFSRIGAAAFKPDLVNIERLCEALGNPHRQFKSIHVAGTNGKGSTSHMLASILQKAGYKTGLYTSPHLQDFRERIRINGEMIEEEQVIAFTRQIDPLITELEPSFFEITVAMAFHWFAGQKVDVAVIEVGLGGRLDSTNIILPEIAVITNIGLDHTNLLGETLPAIAVEKAGIIKPGIPVVIGEENKDTAPVFLEKARNTASPISFASHKRWVTDWQQEGTHLNVTVAEKRSDERAQYILDLPGYYQTRNLLTVLEVIEQLQHKGWQIEKRHVTEGLSNVRRSTGFRGRWEIIKQKPFTVLDVAHNAEGIQQVVEQLDHCFFQKLHIVIGMVKDKDITKVLSLLPKYATYYFTNATIERALPAGELEEKAKSFGLSGNRFTNVTEALQSAIDHAHPEDMVLVCGSVFTVGEVNPEQLKW